MRACWVSAPVRFRSAAAKGLQPQYRGISCRRRIVRIHTTGSLSSLSLQYRVRQQRLAHSAIASIRCCPYRGPHLALRVFLASRTSDRTTGAKLCSRLDLTLANRTPRAVTTTAVGGRSNRRRRGLRFLDGGLESTAFEVERNLAIGVEHAVPRGAANRAGLGLARNLSPTASTKSRHL